MKAQISQVFIYLMTIIVAAFILFYGYRAISVFTEKSEQVSFIQFKNDMENTVTALSLDFGSVKVKEFTVPGNIKTLCLVGNYPSVLKLNNTKYPIIENSVNSGVRKNVFLIGIGIDESFYIENVESAENPLCTDVVSGKIKLRMEGKGDHTFISAAG